MSESSTSLVRLTRSTQPLVPNRETVDNSAPVRIFEQDWMESLTFISFRTFLLFCFSFEGIVLFAMIHFSHSFWHSIFCFISGFLFWLLTEYSLHRFIFHFKSTNKKIQRLIYIFHGNHHLQPNHPYRTLMPIIVTLPTSLMLWALSFYACGHTIGNALFAGFFAGYAFYDSIHFATHNFPMKRFPLSLWKKHHLLHHYRTDDHNYSISFPFLDILFFSKYKL